MRAVKNDLSPGGGFEDILASLRHKAPPAEDDGRQAVHLEKLADHIDEDDPLVCPQASAHDFRHPNAVGESGPADQFRDGLAPLDVAGNEDQLEIGPDFEQTPVNIQNDRFLSFVRASRHQDPFPRSDPQAAGDLPFKFGGDPRREAIVLRVSEDLYPSGGHPYDRKPIRIGP